MRKITLTICTMLLITSAFSQVGKKKSKIEPSNEKATPKINFDLLKSRNFESPRSSVNYSLYSNLDFEGLQESQFKIRSTGKEGNVTWLTGFVNQSKASSWKAKAQLWLTEAYDVLNLDRNTTTFYQTNEWTDKLETTHIKLNQHHNGVKVYAGEVILHGKNGNIIEQNGFYVNSDRFINKKADLISKEEAQDFVKSNLKNFKEDWNVMQGIDLKLDVDQWQSELVYYKNEDGMYDLVYHVKVYPNLAEHYEYFVSGYNGEIVDHFSTICNFHHGMKSESHKNCNHAHGKNHKAVKAIEEKVLPPNGPSQTNATDLLGSSRLINTYAFNNVFFLIDASRGMYNGSQSNLPDSPAGAIWTIDLNNTSPANNNAQYSHVTSNNNSFGSSREGVSAHFNAGQAYEYFNNTFQRESISQSLTGEGQTIHSFVNVADEFGNSMGNAFWNGIGIYYGNGDNAFNSLGRALDVAGHEMSHGVVQNTANLEYRNESGAMNESFADIFGAMIDRDDWQMGEDVVKSSAFPSGALRDLSDPHNGAATGDFGRGWQPSHYNERFTGPQDNGGVHINSGIPNNAFYRFATSAGVGKEKAERIFYRALTTYLTSSSGFSELRFAVVKSAQDLYGTNEVAAARIAFDQVGIVGESEGDFEQDFEENPGDDYLLEADADLSNLYIKTIPELNPFFDPLTTTDMLEFTKPSVADNGSLILFVGADHHIYAIEIDWNADPVSGQQFQISDSPEWDNVAISKDGRFIAAVDDQAIPRIFIFDLLNQEVKEFPLYNPTSSSDGVNTSDVQYADAMEFDATGTSLMYDAYNEISSTNSGVIGFFDIGFLEFWNNNTNSWAEGNIDKLFGSLPPDVQVFNPTYSKNSPFIIAFDVREGFENSMYGVNLESRDQNQIFPNTGLGFPNYSKDDQVLIYDLELLGYTDIGGLVLNTDKISAESNSDGIVSQGRKRGVLFSTGDRLLSDVEELLDAEYILNAFPNPAMEELNIELDQNQFEGEVSLDITNLTGQKVISKIVNANDLRNYKLDVNDLSSGKYLLTIRDSDKMVSQQFIKG
ncbi:MAG: T9SS type A sorting domain-containing protein [Saprospiraceae bacterium]|nr:T9SS type A sorting domain-containing protein [Saprospiraceae bacterium]